MAVYYDPSAEDDFTPESIRLDLLETFRSGPHDLFHVKTPGKGKFRIDEQGFGGMTAGRMELLLCREKRLVFSLSSMAREVVADCILMSHRCKDLVGYIPKRLAREVYYYMQPLTPVWDYTGVDKPAWIFLPDFETPLWRPRKPRLIVDYYIYQEHLAYGNYRKSLQSMIGETLGRGRRIPVFKEMMPEGPLRAYVSEVWSEAFYQFVEDLEEFSKPVYVEHVEKYSPPVFFNYDETTCGCRDCPMLITVRCKFKIPFRPWQYILGSEDPRTIVTKHFEDYYYLLRRGHGRSVMDGFMSGAIR
jgi:hypothetical protein